MSANKKLVIATQNRNKQKEMISLLADMDIEVLTMEHFPHIGDIEETGTTLHENSLIKAREVYKITGLPSLADDTGLEVDALNGDPGVYSARYSGENPTYQDNVNKLLTELKDVPTQLRTARFRTVVTFVYLGVELYEEGVVEGVIASDVKGIKGFGYDPIFKPLDQKLTFAEMSKDKKSLISHRAKAMEKMVQQLNKYFKKGGSIE